MKVQCYAIFDQCSGLYERPFFGQTDDVVKREFQDIVTSEETQIGKHPEHYTLIRLGIFDNETGKLTNEENSSLWTGLEAVSQKQNLNVGNGQAGPPSFPDSEKPGLTD